MVKDGMQRDELNVAHFATTGSITADAISGNSLAVSSTIAASELEASSVGTSEQAFVGTGSPPTYTSRVLYGSGAIPAATSAWVVFGDSFGDVPNIITGTNKGGDVDVFSIDTGSFLVSGTNTTVYHWAAFGSA
jgi:hypothetical protein